MSDTPENVRPEAGEKTEKQVGIVSDASTSSAAATGLAAIPSAGYINWRDMLRDPTIALTMAVIRAPIVAGDWSYESKDDVDEDRVAFIRDQIEPMRRHIVIECLRALSFGWQGFEKVFDFEGGKIRLCKLKPLLQEITTILVDNDTGRFEGFRQGAIDVPVEKSLLFTDGREGDYLYGNPRLDGARKPWAWWCQTNDQAARYDNKVAGSLIIVHYPPGVSKTKAGETKQNFEIAESLLETMSTAKGVVVPNEFASGLDERTGDTGEKRAWLVEVVDAKGGMQDAFKKRLDYLDALKVRGLMRPERSVLEAQTGGLGSSDTADMQDLGNTDGELIHEAIVEIVNWHIVDQLLALNFGEEARGSVYIEAAPLRDRRLGVVLDLIKSWAASPDGREDLKLWLDSDSIIELAGLPKASEDITTPGAPGKPVEGADVTDPAADLVRQVTAGSQGDQVGDSGVATSGLNGAQITAALNILEGLKSGSIDAEQALALLLSMGIDEDKARRIIGGASKR